jgi:hypothetical protein
MGCPRGGLLRLCGTLALLDGGTRKRPELTFYSGEGKPWLVKGRGFRTTLVRSTYPVILNSAVEGPFQAGEGATEAKS